MSHHDNEAGAQEARLNKTLSAVYLYLTNDHNVADVIASNSLERSEVLQLVDRALLLRLGRRRRGRATATRRDGRGALMTKLELDRTCGVISYVGSHDDMIAHFVYAEHAEAFMTLYLRARLLGDHDPQIKAAIAALETPI